MKSRTRPPRTVASIREQIITILTDIAPDLMKTNELSKELGIRATDQDYDMVRESLDELESEGVIFRGPRRRYGRAVPEITVEGRLQGSGRGQWLVIPTDAPNDAIAIDNRDLWTALNGDIVRAKMTAPPRGDEKPKGEITRIISRANETVVGTLQHSHRQFFVEPDDRKIHRNVIIRKGRIGVAKVGDKVVVKLYEWNDPYEEPEGTILRVLGRAGEMKAEIESIAQMYRLPFVFPPEVLREADEFPDEISMDDMVGRSDLREADIFTIDPEDARDFDDAISVEEHDDGDITIGVHIADVSHYVKEGSALDREALKRGTSVYLVTGVIPMLPERLSNDLCSLKPGVDRLTYSVFVRLSPRGAIRENRITKSVIRSKRRFTYDEALAVLETGQGDFARELLTINRMAHVLRELRRKKGSVDFSTTELKFKLDENELPVEVIPKTATESTRLIEDCMLLANRVVAEFVAKKKFPKTQERGSTLNPFIYRIHDVPPKEKLLDLAEFVRTLGFNLPTDNIQPKDIQKLIESVRGTDEEDLVTQVTLRSMAKAVYSEHNVGHFGLAFQYYTHFTSPIRRYPDLIVHRMLDEYQAGMPLPRRREFERTMGGIADQCSERERAAVEAERESIKIAQVQYLKRHVGDVFEATIAGVMPYGIFARINTLGIEGFVRIRTITDDYYFYDERSRSFKGRRHKKSYRLGDSVHVRVIRVDEVKSEIDMELIEEQEYHDEMTDGPEVTGPEEPRDEERPRRKAVPPSGRSGKGGGSRKKAPTGSRGKKGGAVTTSSGARKGRKEKSRDSGRSKRSR